MGTKNSTNKQKNCCSCLSKKVKPENSNKSFSVKEVYILFLIFDYLSLKELTRASQISRGLYWLSGNQLLLFKFQSKTAKVSYI
jgi:hypothetical protein